MTATDTYLLLRAFCDELARCGLEHACTSPGSRNTPILLSLAREPRIATWSHIDERCSAFFALGAAKASGRPVALTCTSGTAAANYAPAVIEASHARVPLIVLTADRPPELRDVGAGQAIDQIKLYGDAVKWFCEVGVDTATPDTLRWIRQLACRAYATAVTGRPGPVHLNFPLREPLVLDGPLPVDPVPGRAGDRPWVQLTTGPPPSAPATRAVPARGVIVAGRDERATGLGDAAARAAERLGWPLLADPLSGARHGASAIATYDLLLRDPGFARRVAPDLVVRVGDLPTSKPLRAWLSSLNETDQLALDPETAWQDPAAVVGEIDRADPVAVLDGLSADATDGDPTWLPAWREADAAAGAALTDGLAQTAALSEPLTARVLGEQMPPEATLVVASSMPIRDAELYLPAQTRG
ncbi:MAG TPA: 2-succinyl-5-enolpyruvyl-6-hydroxy-3-cyclohexene-1-carboxylic-acid synthase, partial [Solirubrobacteraceae bacterium]|nr:2-succinyl-5-enolpyruvyl-6-hydroxy-3-cyclohexene-1-carboxylic-acid synthase [Solirubrobacteraceae bacterium]